MVESFDNHLIVNMNVRNKYSNIILDASIRYNKSNNRIQRKFEGNLIEKTNMRLDIIATLIGR